MKFVKRILRCLLGISLIAGAVFIWAKYRDAGEVREMENLPDYDYVSEIKSLIKEKRYGEAIVLCEDVRKIQLPCASEVSELKDEAEKESKKVWNRIWKAGRSFITGNPDGSIEEIGASVVSDMVIYGDVRDLVKQGWFKITKQETDPLLAALAAAGLATELVDVADWGPAVLKAFRKIGAVSAKMADSLIAMFKNVAKTRKIDKGTKAFFSSTKKMVDSAGLIRTKNMFKYADNAGDLALLAKKSAANPAVTHLVAKHAGTDTVKVMKGADLDYLKFVVRKGRLALRVYKSYHKHKSVWVKLPAGVINTVVGGCGIAGLILAASGLIPLLYSRRKKRAVAQGN